MSRVCVVTGGASGIGASIVKAFVEQGDRVFNLDLQAGALGEFICCDVASVEQVQQAVSRVESEAGTVDVLVSNAGIHFSGTIENTSEEQLERVLSINVKGTYAVIQAVLPGMKTRGKGAIILMASDQALIGKPNSFAYNLSKAALGSMAKTTALDYAAFGIRANAVCPGTIETPLYHQAIDRYCQESGRDPAEVHREEAALQPLGRLGQPDEVAALVMFLASEQAGFITGSLQVIDGGYTTG